MESVHRVHRVYGKHCSWHFYYSSLFQTGFIVSVTYLLLSKNTQTSLFLTYINIFGHLLFYRWYYWFLYHCICYGWTWYYTNLWLYQSSERSNHGLPRRHSFLLALVERYLFNINGCLWIYVSYSRYVEKK